ncbi:heme NO-binding domain-containing protein [Glaciecola petra]|uniref:Heme NO-binding domain-containing protein n=1 Tax=Glaciecola petra TaxID=3075602 RepID=A0ABU2ZT50_9ALTE|nr:heme NO-binding domain-containing protein [Aestuariibacter sp. P117]MDT0595595.1 heme NO-binding domain-containing protein [Aestuariibacter sp. P117]
MYGLINSALKNMITEKFGDEKWQEVLVTSKVPEDSFLTMRSYDDAITYALVESASIVLGESPETCLELFGEYWVLETASKNYTALLDAAGTNMLDFIKNLNALHDRITGTFLSYIPPEFRVENVGEDLYIIHYISTRKGLTSFVVGLLKGLAIRFNADLDIIDIDNRQVETGTHNAFKIRVTQIEN